MIAFAKRNAKEILRDPINLAFGLGFPLVFPSSSEISRLVHRNALPLEIIPANPKNEPIREKMPIADAPS
jgi:hypothetical protein